MNFLNNNNNNNFRNLNNLYAEIAKLQSPTPVYRTVFTDINNEWTSCSLEEQNFIMKDEKYIEASTIYQQQFSQFLIDMFGNQFSASSYGQSAEKVLATIKDARKRYKDSCAASTKNIEEQNRFLIESNKRLAEELRAFKELLGEK